jgi:hypothetical protein
MTRPLDTTPPGAVIGEFSECDQLIEHLRRRAEYIGLSYGVIDQLTEMGEGSTGRYLAPVRSRQLTMASMLRIAEVLGIKAVFVVDEQLTHKWQSEWAKRDGSKVHARRSPSLGPATLKRVLKPAAAELGRRGHLARMAATTPEQRRAIGRRGARARWAHRTGHRPQPPPAAP